jgi:excisionase family DNA binding protein
MCQKIKTIPQPEQVKETGLSLLTKKWFTGDEVCRILCISKRTLQNYRDQRRISFYQIGRKIYYKATDVDDLLERHHIKSLYQKGGAA